MKMYSITRTILCALLSIGFIAPAVAGPGPHESYVPVTTMKQAASIKPGTRIAIECGACGGLKTTIAGKDQNYLHGFTCDRCKKKFVVQTDPHGGIRGSYVCTDDAGHTAKLFVAM